MKARLAILTGVPLFFLLTASASGDQQLPGAPIPGPGPHEEPHLIPQQRVPEFRAQPSARVVDTSTLHFDFGRANLKPEAKTALNELARALGAEPRATVRIEGHTDGVGSEKYNRKLAKRRADAVANYLMRHGIEARRIHPVGLGETQPVADNATKEGRAQNRRVEISKVSMGSAGAALR